MTIKFHGCNDTISRWSTNPKRNGKSKVNLTSYQVTIDKNKLHQTDEMILSDLKYEMGAINFILFRCKVNYFSLCIIAKRTDPPDKVIFEAFLVHV